MFSQFIKYCSAFLLCFPLLVFGQSPDGLQFVENKGQFEKQVLFRAQTGNGYIFLEKNAITLKIFNEQEYAKAHQHLHKEETEEVNPIHGQVIRYLFNKTQDPDFVRGQKPYFEKFNYFLGKDESKWATDVKVFSEVLYKNIYPGIDLKVYSKYGHLKYEWIVSPLADPTQITINILGTDSLYIKNNSLVFHTQIGNVVDRDLKTWQYSDNGLSKVEQDVSCQYVLKGNTIHYHFPKGYIPQNTLIIDPILIFSTYSGSRGDNFGYTATYDVRGNLYAGGITDNTHGEFPVTTGAFQTVCKGGKGYSPVNLPCDITISKYDSSGSKLLYATYIGGTDDDYPHSMVVNGDTELVVFGTTYSKDFPMKSNGYDTTHNSYSSTKPQTDLVIFKLSIHGNKLKGATYFGGSKHDGLTDAALRYNYADDFRGEVLTDKANNIYVVTSTNSDDIPLKNASKTSLEGPADGLCLKFSKDLDQLLWSTYFGGNGSDGIYSLEFDQNENIYIAGGTFSSNLKTHSGAYHKNSNGGIDGFMASFNKSTFAIDKLTYYGTSSYDQIYFLEIDQSGNVYGTGQTEGNITASAGVYSNKAKTGQFICILDQDLTKVKRQTVFGVRENNPEISPSAFLVDSCGNIYLAGWGSAILRNGTTNGLPITSNALQKTTDRNDFYLAVFGKNLSSLLFATYFGGNKSDDHVDGGTSRFDKRGVIYQSVCSSCPDIPGGTLNDFPTTDSSAFPKNVSWRCSNAAFKIDFQISNKVKAKFIPDKSVCGPENIQFTNLSEGTGTYNWKFGDGKSSSVINPIHSYPNSGKYNVQLVAIDSNTCNISDTFTQVLDVLQKPNADFEINNIPCTSEIEIKNNSTLYTTANWDLGDGTTTTVKNPGKHEYLKPGLYKVILITDKEMLCSDTLVVDVFIRTNRYVAADFEPDTIFCAPATIQFNNLSTDSISYLWDFGNGIASTAKEPIYTFDTAGIYKVRLISTDSTTCNVNDTAFRTITALQKPKADFVVDHIRCSKEVDIINKSSFYTTSKWDLGDGTLLTDANPGKHEYLNPGSYKIKLITDGGKLCSDTTLQSILIRVPSYVISNFEPDTAFCVPGEVQFRNLSSDTSFSFWDFGNGNTSLQKNPKITITEAGVYQIRLISSDTSTCNISDTAYRTITADKKSKAKFSIESKECSSRIKIFNESEDQRSSNWDFGDNTFDDKEQPNFHDYEKGEYTIRLITNEGSLCPDTAKLLVNIVGTPDDIIIPVNVFTPDGDGFNDCFHFGGNLNGCSKIKITVYNRWGQKVFETKDFNECWNGKVDNSKKECPEGTYFYICEYKGDSQDMKPLFSGTVTLIRYE